MEQELRERIASLLDDDTHPNWADVVARATVAEIGEESAPPSRRVAATRVTRRRAAVVACLAAAIAAFAALLPSRIETGHGHVGVLDGALAAVSAGPVLHAVLEAPTSQTWASPSGQHPPIELLDLGSGQVRPLMSSVELWYDPDRGLALQTDSVNGTVTWQSLQTPSGEYDTHGHADTSGPPQVDPGLVAFLKGYKQALAQGSAADAGPGNFDGRAVEWLRFPALRIAGTPETSITPEEVAVDRDSFQAVAIRAVCTSCTIAPVTYAVTTLEGASPPSTGFSRPRALDPHPVGLYSATYEAGSASGASGYLGHKTLWAGESVDGLALSGVEFDHPINYSTDTPSPDALLATGKGVTFYYGSLKPPAFNEPGHEPYVSVAETADKGFAFHGFNMEELSPDDQPLTVARAELPPEGQAILTRVGVWSVQLHRDGLDVEIDGTSREAVVDAAQALSPTR